jgi:parallel beta-helix repeat protein
VVILNFAEPGGESEPAPPTDNSVTGNTFSGNELDISYDGSGSGNTFSGNTGCTTSQPEGLCAG